MTSSSSSLLSSVWKYDVFLSFRGEETRKCFVSYLYTELVRKGIHTFQDDKKLEKGSSISPVLLKTIEDSKFSIVVISANYASSGWCLDELVKIMDCSERGSLTAIPVFYEVDPSEVRKLTGSFAKAFESHEEKFKDNPEKVQRWKGALTRVAHMAGEDSRNWGNEMEMIQKLVKDISDRLFSIPSEDIGDFVGMEAHMEAIAPLLCMESSNEIRVVGFWGMGGVGKTTIAGCLYNQHWHNFQAHCFIRNVKEITQKHSLQHLQEHFLSEILQDRDIRLRIPELGSNAIKARLRHLKVLVILDDVDKIEELDAIIKEGSLFGLGSKIIITTRDRHLLVAHGVKHVYEVRCLSLGDAVHLFSRYAFRQKQPENGFERYSVQAAEYVGGLPLGLKVLGSFLRGRRKEEWKSALCRLERVPHKDIMNVLRASYDGLQEQEKDIFLYVACFFRGESIDGIERMLDSCGYSTTIGIQVLTEKSLLEVSDLRSVDMHDLLQQMGRELVNQQSINEPGKRRFLWSAEDICEMLAYSTGTEAVEAISFDMLQATELVVARANAFERMRNLKFLRIYHREDYIFIKDGSPMKIHLPAGLNYLSPQLRSLHWMGYPLKTLPFGFRSEYLVEIRMSNSNLEKLWKRTQPLWSLRTLDLHGSNRLKKLPDLSTATNLEVLDLRWCGSLVEVHSSVQSLNKLAYLYMHGCIKLRHLPKMINSRNISLQSCYSLTKVPENFRRVVKFELGGARIEELPPSILHLCSLTSLILVDCKRLKTLSDAIGKMTSLQSLIIAGCRMLGNIPDTMENLKSLNSLQVHRCPKITEFPHVHENIGRLHLNGTGIKEVPLWTGNLSQLQYLSLCRSLKPVNVSYLSKFSDRCVSKPNPAFSWIPSFSNFTILRALALTNLNLFGIPNDLGHMSKLRKLDLAGSDFEAIPTSVKDLSWLLRLDLNNCRNLRSLPELPHRLNELYANGCTSLGEATSAFRHDVSQSSFGNCFKLHQNIDLIVRHLVLITKRISDRDSICRHTALMNRKARDADPNADIRVLGSPMYVSPIVLLPGREVPKQFSFQAVGPLLTVKLRHGRLSSEIVGFIACFVIGAEMFRFRSVGWNYNVQDKQGHLKFEDTIEDICCDAGVASNHDHLVFFGDRIGHMTFNKYTGIEVAPGRFWFDEISFQFYLVPSSDDTEPLPKIKECGVHLVFIEDLEGQCEGAETPSGSCSVSTLEEHSRSL